MATSTGMRYGYALMGGLLLLAAAMPARAQKLVRRFAGSTVLLTTGDTLRGPLFLYTDQDILLVRRPDGTIRTLTPWQVRAFAVKGELTGYDDLLPAPTAHTSAAVERLEQRLVRLVDTTVVRTFISYRARPQARQQPNKTSASGFYELLCDGPVSLLRREALQLYYPYPLGAWGADAVSMPRPRYRLVSSFFLRTTTDRLAPLHRPRRDLAVLLPQQAPKLEHYAQLNRLDYANAAQLRAIVRYANNLLLDAR